MNEVLDMYVILVGGGRTGKGLAEELVAGGHEVIVIEENEKRALDIQENLDCAVIHGDGTDLEVLEDAMDDDVDALVALTPSDESNLITSKLAKTLEIPKVITRVNDEKNESMFQDVGADIEINMISAGIELFKKALTGPQIYGMISRGGKVADVMEAQVTKGSKVNEKKLEDLDFPKLVNVPIITRDNELIPPRGNTKLREGDRVLLAGDHELISEKVQEYFAE